MSGLICCKKLTKSRLALEGAIPLPTQIFNLQSIIKKYYKKKGRCYVLFVDFATAFDSVPHSSLWFKLINSGIHGNILTVLRSMYAVLKSCIRTPEV